MREDCYRGGGADVRKLVLAVDPEIARWARAGAREQQISLSRFIGEILSRQMTEEAELKVSRRRFLVRPARLTS